MKLRLPGCSLAVSLPCKGIQEGFSDSIKPPDLKKKTTQRRLYATQPGPPPHFFSRPFHMIFCLSPLLTVCSDGTVPRHKLDSPCCRDARCRMNTSTTGGGEGEGSLQTLLAASKTQLHCRKYIKPPPPTNPRNKHG